MIKFVGLGLMALVLMALCYEIGYCQGFEENNEDYEKFVKGESDEEKNC